MRQLGGDRFEALSAGSRPAGYIHPLASEAMKERGLSLDEHRSKSWEEFAEAPVDLVITVCDAAAGAICPTWPGSPISVHWSMPDPAGHPGTEAQRLALAMRVAERLETKIRGLVDLDWSLPHEKLVKRLQFLGEI